MWHVISTITITVTKRPTFQIGCVNINQGIKYVYICCSGCYYDLVTLVTQYRCICLWPETFHKTKKSNFKSPIFLFKVTKTCCIIQLQLQNWHIYPNWTIQPILVTWKRKNSDLKLVTWLVTSPPKKLAQNYAPGACSWSMNHLE